MENKHIDRLWRGEIQIGDYVVPCYMTPDEVRFLSGRGVSNLLGLTDPDSKSKSGQVAGSRIRRLFTYSAFKPILEQRLGVDHIDSLKISTDDGFSVIAFEATNLVDLFDAILTVRDIVPRSKLTKHQQHIIERADILIRSVAKVGIIALIDEATGWQYYRERTALEKMLNTLIAPELQPWSKLFPDEFYMELFDKYGYKAPRDSSRRPRFFAKVTIDLVYDRIPMPGGIYKILKNKSTDPETKRRNTNRLHQWLTTEGRQLCDRHIWSLVYGARGTPNLPTFKRWVERAHPKMGHTINLFSRLKEEDEE
ncbi:MAG: P63C domain-containing protein [Candidatus Electryonea clarkiae]|nr:P63C domain-containing protein [Candidatus Electryonea clarkiae]MDP8288838.1 P63C domain-containing protein [Candidatus Electryonea clarkiae]